MSRPVPPRGVWLESIFDKIEQIGECCEWTGTYMGKTPVVYSPKGYAFDGSKAGKQSVRPILWSMVHGERLGESLIIRMKCRNDCCVAESHMRVIDRSKQCVEMSKRGELNTTRRKLASMRTARINAKVTPAIAAQIRESTDSGPVEAKKHGISTATVNAIRSGRMWNEVAANASVFTWRGGA